MIGLKEDNTNAGYDPAMSPITMANTRIDKICRGCTKYDRLSDFPDNWLNNGNKIAIRPKATRMLTKLIRIDSIRN